MRVYGLALTKLILNENDFIKFIMIRINYEVM